MVTLGIGSQATNSQIDFKVVHFTSGSIAILGRATLHAFQAVSSTYHQSLKFPTKVGICIVKGSQKEVQSCYMMSTFSSESMKEARKKQAEEIMQNAILGYLAKQRNKMERDF